MAHQDAGKIRSFKDLHAWRQAHDLVVHTYKLTKGFPRDELFGIVNQMRRAAVSVPSNIAEGFTRNSNKEKAQFYAIAKGSLTELESQFLISRDLGYISGPDFNSIQDRMYQLGKIITGLVKAIRLRNGV